MNNKNEVLENILTRRSIRSFEQKCPPDDLMQDIVTAACFAPSGHNKQLCRFIVIKNKGVLKDLNELVKSTLLKIEQGTEEYEKFSSLINNASKEEYCFFYGAPALIVVLNDRANENAMADSACALENIFLAANSLGVGSCYINQLKSLGDKKEIREFLKDLGAKGDFVICGSAAVGYANGVPAAPMRKSGTVITVE